LDSRWSDEQLHPRVTGGDVSLAARGFSQDCPC
jgi:hypothetical protein